MKYGRIKGVDKPISRIVHGTIMLASDQIEKSYSLLDEMYSLGINTFDTASSYGGDGEAVLTSWIHERSIREDVVVLSKCAHPNKWRNRVTPFDIQSDIQDYMAKPGADYIDIYMLHRDDQSVEIGPIIEKLNELKSNGQIKTFGASNWRHNRIEDAAEYAYKHGLESFSSISPHFSLGEQVNNPWDGDCVTLTGIENKPIRDSYISSQMPIFSYSTLCKGFFSGRFKSNELEKAKEILEPPAQLGYMYECNFKRLERVEGLAQEKGVSVSCLSLAWALNQPLNVFALIGTGSKERMIDNIKSFEIKLTEEELKWLNLEK